MQLHTFDYVRRERRSDHILFYFGEIQRENMKEVVMCVELENEKFIVYIIKDPLHVST